MASVRSPQAWELATLTERKAPGGGLAWPRASSPQQASVVSPRTPQVEIRPALMAGDGDATRKSTVAAGEATTAGVTPSRRPTAVTAIRCAR